TPAQRDRVSVVYGLGRDDMTDANLNTTVTLLDSQRLLGAGIDQTIQTSLGPITLPAASSGVAPLLTNSAAPNLDVITLADNNEVSGFTIDASGSANAISGTSINSFNIHDNTLQNFIEGVAVTHVGAGRAEFINNVVTGNGFRTNRGLSIDHTTGTLDLLVQNNTFAEIRGEDANGDGLITPSEDLNGNGILDGGEDVNGNGILDLGEDVNSNGILDRGIAVEIVANGSTINASDLTGMQDVGIFDNTFTSTGTGLELIAQGGATAFLDIQNNSALDSTDEMGAGFNLLADGSTINLHNFGSNTATGGQGDGLRLVTDNNGTIIVADPLLMTSAFNGNDLSDNAGDGAFVLADSGTITFDFIGDRLGDDPLGNMFNRNGDDGLELQTMAGGTINVINPLLGNQFNDNGDNGLVTTALTGMINIETSLTSLSNSFTGNGTTTGTGAGISYVVGPGGVINTGVFDLTISGNAGNGIAFILDGGTINLTGFDRNTFTDNGLNGVLISNSNGGTFITPTVANNDFSNNGQAGMFITGDGGAGGSTINLGNVVANSFDRDIRGTEGILFDTVNVTTTLNVLRNSFVGRNTAGDLSGRGIGGVVRGGGLNMFVGNFSTADANMFQNNADAHIGLTLRGDSINTIEIDNSLFEGAVNNPGTTEFLGGGVAVRLRDTAKLTGFVRRSMFLNNEDDGLRMDIAGNNPAGNRRTDTAQLNDFVIGGAAPGDGNVFQGNGDDGLSIVR
ncbi:MAG: beta strand repeat-containing protein, partial [Maioricimonas sp. JB049]